MRNLLDDNADERPDYGYERPCLLLDGADGDVEVDAREASNLLADSAEGER